MNTYSFNYGGVKATGSTAVGGVTGTFIPTTPFQLGDTSARYKINSELVNGVPCKTLVCSTAGLVTLDLTALTAGSGNLTGFGEWQFWIYKGGSSNAIDLTFIASLKGLSTIASQQGYGLNINAAELLYFYRVNNTSFATVTLTSAAYIVDSTWYRYRITRDVLGVFTTYIKGGAFTDETLVVSAGGGSNPSAADRNYFAANFLNLDMDAGDKMILASADGTMGLSHKMIA